MENLSTQPVDLEKALQVENDLERKLIRQPTFQKGLLWGVPRYGHPEGAIYKHVQEVYQNIDQLEIDPTTRFQLRIIALTHDTFKYLEDKKRPRDWSRHHAVLARQFLEKYTDDAVLLKIVELHDEAYYAWRLINLFQKPLEGEQRLQRLLQSVGKDIQLYYLFFKCDTRTGDKNQAPLKWFEKNIPGIQKVNL
ncbi:MAG: HD domain-containing protein [Saprospiraceae bacterium]|nr:HD domain-containing protein [Saprospiraceae bacterium]